MIASVPTHCLPPEAANPQPDPWPQGWPLEPNGLWAALHAQARHFMGHSAAQCHWSLDIPPGLSVTNADMAAAVLRIFEELLSNVDRHAQASEVRMRISAHASDITIVVQDNGRGAPPSAFDRLDAHGVMAMRERATRFGGWLHIDSQMGMGTKAILTMPMYQRLRGRT